MRGNLYFCGPEAYLPDFAIYFLGRQKLGKKETLGLRPGAAFALESDECMLPNEDENHTFIIILMLSTIAFPYQRNPAN